MERISGERSLLFVCAFGKVLLQGMGWGGIGWLGKEGKEMGREGEEEKRGREEGGKKKERKKKGKRIACIRFLGTWDGVGRVVDVLGQREMKGEREKEKMEKGEKGKRKR